MKCSRCHGGHVMCMGPPPHRCEEVARLRKEPAQARSMSVLTRMIRESLTVMMLAVTLAGCLGPIPVSLPSAAPAPVPAQGRRVSVAVSDERSEKSPARVGILLGISRDFMLVGDAPLAMRLEDELLTALRTRSYRAEHASDASAGVDVALVIRVVRFAADVRAFTTMRFQGRSVLVAHVIASDAPESRRTDVIDTREDVSLGKIEKTDSLSKLVERFFQKVLADLSGRVSAALPPPGGGA